MATSALWIAACSSGSAPPASTTSTTRAAVTSTTGARSTTTSGTLQPQNQISTEFLSPSKNISCEIDNGPGASAITSAFCLTISPPASVTLKTESSLTECTGQQCLANAGEGTPTLQYGQSITLGPFTCASSTAGVKCTLGNGDGFQISTSGVLPLGNAEVSGGGSTG